MIIQGHAFREMQGNCSAEEASSSSAAAMEEQLWQNLPQELVGRVLPWLPITSLLRSHTLCKEFHSWLSTTSFLIEYAQVPPRPPWLLLFPDAAQPSAASAYDPSSDAWLHLPFTFLPFEIRLLAAAQGLLCVMPKRGICSSSSLFLCNPVTRSWVEFPRPQVLSRFFFLVVAMSVTRVAFTIVVAGSELVSEDSASFNLSAEVFDSSTWAWRRGGSVFVEAPISPCKAISSGRLFVVAGTGIIAYDLELGSWSRIEAPGSSSSRPLVSMKLVDRMGSLIVVGGVGHQGADYDICIWELQLQPGGCEWRELDWMPHPFRNELLKPMSRRFACLGDGDVIYFSSKRCPTILVYRFSSRIWKWASCCNSENLHYDMLHGVCFEPRLDANPHCASNSQSCSTCPERASWLSLPQP